MRKKLERREPILGGKAASPLITEAIWASRMARVVEAWCKSMSESGSRPIKTLQA